MGRRTNALLAAVGIVTPFLAIIAVIWALYHYHIVHNVI